MTWAVITHLTALTSEPQSTRQYSIKICGYEFISSIFFVPLGVVFSNIGRADQEFRLFGNIFSTIGVLFLIGGIHLALGLATNKILFVHIWFVIETFLVVFHLVLLGLLTRIIELNGDLDRNPDPNVLIAVFYGVWFTFGFISLLIQGLCTGLMVRYRGLMVEGKLAQDTHKY
ncbi:hypothetical protein BV898_06139 [Hypsibius exemplaris]|uniref:Uncharacterized protein n=1 Tax=Hypsibius exemplaris TaxID=2072580 RepID=A0A1W0WXD8_HYPEX|nr:hypothetical protein BV898_06139 [Hypsibius exemplaris]